MSEFGSVRIKMDELIRTRGISKNHFCHLAQLQSAQLNSLDNSVTRLDTAVLCRICMALDCRIEDLLEFIPRYITSYIRHLIP